MWHLGSVTAACLAEAGHDVVGFDPDGAVVSGLNRGHAPLQEPGLDALLKADLQAGHLSFTTDAARALRGADVLWVTFDTPVNDRDEADVTLIRRHLDAVLPHLQAGILVLISSQIPVGFTADLERDWAGIGLQFGVSPENLRLGKALDCFRQPERIIVGIRQDQGRETIDRLFSGVQAPIEWMSIESAEMTKHALNAFLAASVTFVNELARLCEVVGADAKDVERGLKTDGRIGPRAYLTPGSAFAGGTLARDVRFLLEQGIRNCVATPFFEGVWSSNEIHKNWLRSQVTRCLAARANATVAVLGLTYKPGTNTLRRSTSVDLCRWLHGLGVRVQVHDPAALDLPDDLARLVDRRLDPLEALDGADLAVVATEWPEYRALKPEDVCAKMRRPRVIDPNHFLASALGKDPRIAYVAAGKAA
jgi:UDPglucose 6-dehydrogenase